MKELIDSILSLDRNDIEVVVTDNCSTDGTEEMLLSYKDRRLKYYKNQSPIAGLSNIVRSLFNASGKYGFYINDRDLIDVTLVNRVINVLESNCWACLELTERKRKNITNKICCFGSGGKALCNIGLLHHPTGLVVNAELVRRNLSENDYFQYSDTYPYDFLLMDLACYGDVGNFDVGIWYQRKNFKAVNKAASISKVSPYRLYFTPDARFETARRLFLHVLCENKMVLEYSNNDRYAIARHIFLVFSSALIDYKGYYSNKEECIHYGIKKKFISYFVMKHILYDFEKMYLELMVNNSFNDVSIEKMNNEIYKNRKKFKKEYFRVYEYAAKRNVKKILSQIPYLNNKYKLDY
ncbi:MAG: glycosyltransferase family 2 protein [Lachnospiraceae bacterium]|nr:glycosyltransferase family 2 protein [Lachnospiraceae bacterium]